MKKSSFLEGAFIGTVAVVICKVLGLLYVIPFYAIIGSQGGALYSYAYSIYAIFISLASSGIPVAMSKVVSEYDTLGYNNTKERAYKIGSRVLIIMGIIFFLILFIFAPQIAYMIKGNITGGNTLEDVSLVIRVIATAILIVPAVAVRRGYLEGHNRMIVSNVSLVIEQLVRVVLIVLGSYLAYKIFKWPLRVAVSIAVFGATIGALISYIYIERKIKKNPDIKGNQQILVEEKKYTDKLILKKIVLYALPFVLISVLRSIFSSIDAFTVIKGMVNLGYDVNTAESVFGITSTWAAKLNMIVTSLVTGLSVALVPNMMSSFVKKDYKDVSHKINQSIQVLLVSVLPIACGLSFLAYPVWVTFYGYSELGISIFSFYVFTAVTLTFNSILVDATQTINNTKVSIGSLLIAFAIKALLNVPMMYVCDMIGIEAYYGPMIATVLAHITGIIILMINLKKQINVSYKKTFNIAIKILLDLAIMFVVLYTLRLFIPIEVNSRFMAILICTLYAVVGGIVYIYIAYKFDIIDEIVGNDKAKKYINKFIKKSRKK